MKKQTTLKTSVFASIVSFLGINGDQAGYIMLGAVALVLAIVLAISFANDKKRKQNAPKPIDISDKKQPAQKAEQKVAEQPKAVEQKPAVEAVVATQTPVSENDEVLMGIEEETGLAIVARYKWTFMARLIQAPDEIKGFYSDLKNQLLSYNKVSSRVSSSYDSINLGRKGIAKFNVRGKTLYLYLALDPTQFDGTKYNVIASTSKKYEAVPCLYKIKSERKFKWAKQLVDILAQQLGLVAGEVKNDDYRPASMTLSELIAQGYVKELVSKEDYDEYLRKRALALVAAQQRATVSASEAHSIIDDESAATLITDLRKGAQVKSKKAIVNIDTLSQKFAANDVVNIKALAEKGVVPKNTTFVKVLARGYIDKPLIVELQDYSLDAVKMIVITGGQVHKV
ncbi:MAG: uL15 family ribosomal protein [Clostridia bacterium]|nr:uL15 family ribosomal protein [Clostridia bacterium]